MHHAERPLTLYYAPGSSSMATHIALVESGLPFEAHPISLARLEQRSSAFLDLNPEGKVPVLKVGERVLTEVAATLFYVAHRAPQAGLWPFDDLLAQARVVSWMSFCASTLHPARRQDSESIQAVFRLAERRLAGNQWAVDHYSIADIHLFRLFLRMRRSIAPILDTLPGLKRHFQTILSRSAVREVMAVESREGYQFPI